ncbi:hypothetical protein MPER_02499 [Moniliophthora perniciosa FA553]|nr:hypothetical protein MPER_02499 [Moniliophthora perniciosa FA553]
MLLLYTLARPILTRSAAEFNATLAEPNTSIAQCNDLGQCRSLSDVLWTCASVIFICTWVAVHPNVPHPKDRTMIRWVKDLLVTFFALIAPELMMLWSMRQYQASQLVWKKYEVYTGWTKAHAYLVVMGGFALYEQNQGQDTCLGILRDRDKLEDEPKHLR